MIVRSGDLKRSMTKKRTKGNITIIGKGSAIFGSTLPCASVHDEGKGHIPRRNFSDPSDRRIGIMRSQIEDYLVGALRREGISVDK